MRVNWSAVSESLDAEGCARIEGLISPDECSELAALYARDGLFRSKVVMARHGFGRGEYKYFAYPLPDLIAELRTTVYPRLLPRKVGTAGVWARVNAGGLNGGGHTCAVSTGKSLYCWGYNHYGQIGDGSPEEYRPTPRRIL